MRIPKEYDTLYDTGTKGNKEVEVFTVLDERAGEHTIAALGQTVAEYNDCDPDDRVVVGTYVNDDGHYASSKKYAFPLSRLSWEDPDK